jgi:hypothetical protein
MASTSVFPDLLLGVCKNRHESAMYNPTIPYQYVIDIPLNKTV